MNGRAGDRVAHAKAESQRPPTASAAAASSTARTHSPIQVTAYGAVLVAPDSDEHHECCLKCGGIGRLLCCDNCPFVYHLKCVGLASAPKGFWRCDICLGLATLEEYRRTRQEARQQPPRRKNTRSRSRVALTPLSEVEELDPEEEDGALEVAVEVVGPLGPHCGFCRQRRPPVSFGYQLPHPADPIVHEERLLGPFHDDSSRNSEGIYTHRSCALWSPRVFVLGGKLQNVVAEVSRARWLWCSVCGKRGASIGCCDKDCQRSFHYKCAKETQCCMVLPGYEVYCVDHAIAPNLTRVSLPEPVLQLRLANAAQALAGRMSGIQPTNAIIDNPRRKETGLYNAAQVYSEFLAAQTAVRLKKESRFAHISHLPYDERKRRVKAELRIRSLAEEEADRAHEVAKMRKRKRALMTEQERALEDSTLRAAQKQKTEEDAKILDEMNSASSSSALPSAPSAAAASSPPSGWSLIGGLTTQIASIKECVMLPLLYPEIFRNLHITAPKGILLVGPPGTGKTLLARALSQSCSLPGHRPITFYARKGADILSRFHGDAELTLRTLFDVAKRNAPSIIFFDEIDGLTPVRSAKQNQVHASVVTTLLALMDGLDSGGDVFVLASTNRIDAIDPALRRPGRFDREVYIGLPSQQQRQEILRIHTAPWPAQSQLSEEDCQKVASTTVGFSGADLRALCSEAALLAAHRTIGPTLMTAPGATPTSLRSSDVLDRLPGVSVSMDDFTHALGRLTSSVRRHDQSGTQQQGTQSTSEPMLRLMQAKLREARSVLDLPVALFSDKEPAPSKPVEFVPMEDDDVANQGSIANPSSLCALPLTLPSTIHRLLICDAGPAPVSRVFVNADGDLQQRPWRVSPRSHNPALLTSALISNLDMESCVIHQLDIPSLLTDEHALTLAEACVRRFQAAQNTTTNLFYLPRLDEWWSQTSIPSLHPLRAALISSLRNLTACAAASPASASTCNIFLATTTCNRTSLMQMDLHPFLADFFRSHTTVSCTKPNPLSAQAFFTTMVREAALALGQSLAHRKEGSHVVSSLAEAPPPQPEETVMTDELSSTAAVPPAIEVPSPTAAPPAAAAAPTPVAPSPPLLQLVTASFDAFMSGAALPLVAVGRSLQVASAPLDFAAMQRVQFEVERWTSDQLIELRCAHRRVPPNSDDETIQSWLDEFGSTDAAPRHLPWSSLVQAIAAACQQCLERAQKIQSESATEAARPNEWQQLAAKHAAAPARLR